MCQAEAVGFADYGIAAHGAAQFGCDLAGAQALPPELGETINPLRRPGLARIRHRRPPAESPRSADRHLWPTSWIMSAEEKVAPRLSCSTQGSYERANARTRACTQPTPFRGMLLAHGINTRPAYTSPPAQLRRRLH